MSRFRFGDRGEFPVRFEVKRKLPTDHWRRIVDIPGVRPTKKGFKCAWDCAPIVAKELGQRAPNPPPQLSKDRIPGYAEYRRLGLHEKLRPYQRKRARFIAERSWSMCTDDTRTGKTYSITGGAVASGSPRNLLVVPAIARNVWPRVIRQMCGDDTQILMLYGRAASKARWFGERAYIYEDPTKINNWTLDDAFAYAKWVVINFDLLLAQSDSDATGYIYKRDDLPGWVDRIIEWDPQFAAGDEWHRVRGWKWGEAGPGEHRREKTREALKFCPQVVGGTATPQYTYFRDWWGQVNTVSGGVFDGYNAKEKRYTDTPFNFHRRYCGGEKKEVEHGPAGGVWLANKCSPLAEKEWPERRKIFDIGQSRKELMPWLPDIQHEVIRIEGPSDMRVKLGKRGTDSTKLRIAQRQEFKLKRTPVKEAVMLEMRAGHKCAVYTDLREHAKAMYSALTPKRGQVPGARIYYADGGIAPEARDRLAEAFRNHEGPAAFVATIKSMPEALSLQGADTVHFVELDDSPMANKQAGDRPNEDRKEPLTWIYYCVEGLYGDHKIEMLLPKIQALAAAASNKEAAQVAAALAPPEETSREIMKRITAHLKWDPEAE